MDKENVQIPSPFSLFIAEDARKGRVDGFIGGRIMGYATFHCSEPTVIDEGIAVHLLQVDTPLVRLCIAPGARYDPGTHYFMFSVVVPNTVRFDKSHKLVLGCMKKGDEKDELVAVEAEKCIHMVGTSLNNNNHTNGTAVWPPLYTLDGSLFESEYERKEEQPRKERARNERLALLRTHAKRVREQGALVEHVVYENERWIPVLNWWHKPRLPTDRYHWTDENHEFLKMKHVDSREVNDDEWKVLSTWQVDLEGTTNDEGWKYATNWPETWFGSTEWSTSMYPTAMVRTRRWVKKLVCTTRQQEYHDLAKALKDELAQFDRDKQAEYLREHVRAQDQWSRQQAWNKVVQTYISQFTTFMHGLANGSMGIDPATPSPLLHTYPYPDVNTAVKAWSDIKQKDSSVCCGYHLPGEAEVCRPTAPPAGLLLGTPQYPGSAPTTATTSLLHGQQPTFVSDGVIVSLQTL
eukprot:TRINITY_DN6102_c0_g1_i1.p1 TRINITY_DN6102_c0_g1~~TRINITY_DN6102_c0_g1_i1.p1  ORF type:complete len:464 (-),score=53.60 TRINITY_DN6102_c0_g1_i1:148-1539(-)